MNIYWMMRKGMVTGPFNTEELRKIKVLSSDLFARDDEELSWLPPSDIPEISRLFFSEATYPQLYLPDAAKKQPEKSSFRRMFSETEFRIYFKNFLDTIQTARVAALFVITLTATLFIKLALDRIVENNFAYMHSALMHPPVVKTLPASKNFRNAIVKNYIDPAAAPKKIQIPARPKDVFKLVQVNGKSSPAEDQHPTSLLITVTNQSHYLVDNAEIEVMYETSGKPLIEKYQFTFLSPMGSKTMSVPLIRQNVKVRYRVLNIYTSQYTSLQREV